MKLYGICFSINRKVGSGKNVSSLARKEALLVGLTSKVETFFNQDISFEISWLQKGTVDRAKSEPYLAVSACARRASAVALDSRIWKLVTRM